MADDVAYIEALAHPQRRMAGTGQRFNFRTDSGCNLLCDLLDEDGGLIRTGVLSYFQLRASTRAEETLF
jgi:hypothetical protein